jgi:hypothetical protein
MSFLLARLTSWGSLLALFPPGLPPIHNSAQPGKLEAWRGKRVLWAGLLMYPAPAAATEARTHCIQQGVLQVGGECCVS